MPIIISGPADNRPRFTHAALADTSVPAVQRTRFEHAVSATSSRRRSLAHPARTSGPAARVRVSHLAATSPSLRARFAHPATGTSSPAALPSVVRRGRLPRTTFISSSLGRVISAQYSHTGTRETLTMTLSGLVNPAGALDLTVTDFEGSQRIGGFSVSLNGDLTQFEQRSSASGGTTILRGENRNARRLGSVRLDELIPWKLSPTPLPDRRVPCGSRPKPQSIDVSGIVARAFIAAGMGISYPAGDPLTGQSWKENEREYSTLGKTPDQVFADTYGQLGLTYVVLSADLVAVVSVDGSYRTQFTTPEQLTDEMNVRVEAGNTPSLLTVTGADLLVKRPDLIELAQHAPDPDSLLRELYPDIEWYVTTPTETGETIKGFRKALGVITYANELTRSNVTVMETVDGVQETRTFSGVVTGYTMTESRYDGDCTDALTYQRTVKQSYGYGLRTETSSSIFSGPSWGGSYETGDLLADELQTVYQTFSPEGYLSARTTVTRKLASLEQLGADGPVDERGPLKAREYVTQTLSENYQPLGGGQWLRVYNLSGDQQLPLYDTESGDAVRLASRGGTFSSAQEVLDQAPAQVRCPDPCGEQMIAYPQVVRQHLDDGREGLEVSRALPFVESGLALESFASGIAQNLAATKTKDFTLASVQDWRPGVRLTGAVVGTVQTYSLDAEAGVATVKISALELLQNGSAPTKLPEGPGPWRDMVLWRRPGGVVVNHVREIKDGVPLFDEIFVRATGANLPSPGDEIEWRRDTRFGPTATGNYGT